MVKFKTGTLRTSHGNKEFEFQYKYHIEYSNTYKADTYFFDVWEDGRLGPDFFDFQLRVMENGNDLKVVSLFAGNYHKGKGIPKAILLEAIKLFNKRIISVAEGGWPEGSKFWERMRKEGIVEYDNENKYYYTV